MEDTRSYNIGASDYSKHKFQSWDFWITFALNPFDADLVKRTLRTKETDGRLMDYQKIKHIAGERIRQLENRPDVWPSPKQPEGVDFDEMIEDYHLCDEDKDILKEILYSIHRKEAYKRIQILCDMRIKQLS